MTAERSHIAAERPANAAGLNGTRVGNGSAILPGVDGRTAMGRRLREIVGALVSDMGGETELTEAKLHIVRRVAVLAAQLEQIEADAANGVRAFDIGTYSTGANTLRRLLADLGLERRQRDVTVDLQTYLARANGAPAE
jgi:hypothetical protein